jgi:GTP-binding protein Era
MSTQESPRAGRVAIVGRPNVGKSTLLNALLGQKLAITTPRPGTTRSCLLGVYFSAEPPTQIAFVDTPGLERPRSVLGRVLVETAQGAIDDVDAVLVLVDATRRGPGDDPIHGEDAAILEQVQQVQKHVVLVLNKVDKIKDKSELLPKLAAWAERYALDAIVPVSALRGDNLAPVIASLREQMPEGMLYDPEFLTDRPERFFVAELVREALIRNTRQEVPHALAVQIERFEDDTNITRIDATIVVDKASHKGIVIGKGGAMLKQIGTEAREEIEKLLDRKVFIKLFVRVEADWTRDAQKVRRLTTESS